MTSERLGRGAFGVVFKELFNGRICAVKKVSDDSTTDEKMQKEYEIYCTVDHSNVVKLVDRIEKRGRLWHIPMELINGQTLKDIIFHRMRCSFELTPRNKSHIITGMCEGLLYLHSNDIIHRDLKPDNIMVENVTLRPVIIDLGFAKFPYGGFYSSFDKGNSAYAAPEVLYEPYTKRNKKSDVWALGKIIAELLVEHQLETRSPAHYQKLLSQHRGYCQSIIHMLDGSPIPRASMASVIGRIREAQGQVEDDEPLFRFHIPITHLPAQPHSPPEPAGAWAMELYQDAYSILPELPPGFKLPKPLPPDHTIVLN